MTGKRFDELHIPSHQGIIYENHFKISSPPSQNDHHRGYKCSNAGMDVKKGVCTLLMGV